MEQITISNIKIDVIRKDIKNIHLAVYPPTGRVRIAAPLNVNDDAIRLFAISKLGWIKRNQRKFEGQVRIPQREYKQRESHYFQGRRYLMTIVETEGTSKVVLKNKKFIELHIKPGTPTIKRHEILTEWYRVQLKKQIPAIIDKWENLRPGGDAAGIRNNGRLRPDHSTAAAETLCIDIPCWSPNRSGVIKKFHNDVVFTDRQKLWP